MCEEHLCAFGFVWTAATSTHIHVALNFEYKYYVWVHTDATQFTENTRHCVLRFLWACFKYWMLHRRTITANEKNAIFFREGTEKSTATTDFIVKRVWRGEPQRFELRVGPRNTTHKHSAFNLLYGFFLRCIYIRSRESLINEQNSDEMPTSKANEKKLCVCYYSQQKRPKSGLCKENQTKNWRNNCQKLCLLSADSNIAYHSSKNSFLAWILFQSATFNTLLDTKLDKSVEN